MSENPKCSVCGDDSEERTYRSGMCVECNENLARAEIVDLRAEIVDLSAQLAKATKERDEARDTLARQRVTQSDLATLREMVRDVGTSPVAEAAQILRAEAAEARERALRGALNQCRVALEPFNDVKPRKWVTDYENLARAHHAAIAALRVRGDK